jgi:small-conductance mechanosensitive channel
MEFAAFWEQVRTGLGIDEPNAAWSVAKAMQIIAISLVTLWVGRWVSGRIRRAALVGHIYADVAAIASRLAAIAILATGAAIVLAILGVSPTAIAALLGAATVGVSLAFQDVSRAFVDGLYVLVERPFKIGDRIRVDIAEGRVEEIGIRLTRLRSDSGHDLIVPNTVVFSNIVENLSAGQLDRRRFLVVGVTLPVQDIELAIVEQLRGGPHLSPRQPVVAILESRPDGTDVEVTVEHDLGHRVDAQIVARLRTRFPEATISTGRLMSAS